MTYRTIDTSNYTSLMSEYNIQSLLAKIICSFDYSKQEIASFFSPLKKYEFNEDVYKPIKEFLEEIKLSGKKAFIFGDYDCDGICATTIMKKILDKLAIPNAYYIPDRVSEGYGLNLDRLAQAHENGYDVLITVDNGVGAHEPLKWAKEHGMKVLVTDHHIITEPFEHDCLLHPSLMSKDYSYLCGAGVAYMLAEYLKLADDSMCVLAMSATIADVMSLKGINIKIINDGLTLLKMRSCANIGKLIETDLATITEEDISFRVAPKINAIGRLNGIVGNADPNFVVEYLLLNQNEEMNRINKGAYWIKGLNQTRQQLSNQQCEIVEGQLDQSDCVNVVYDSDLSDGLLGLIASRIAKKTNKVTFIFTDCEEGIKGSGRGIKGVNLVNILEGFKDNTLHFGGHSQACGITMSKDKLQMFSDYLRNHIEMTDVTDEEAVLDLSASEMNYLSLKELFSYRPFGQDRRIPLIRTFIENPKDYSMLRNENQLKWVVGDVSFISFSDNKGYNYYLDKSSLEIIGELKENIFNGRTSYQVIIKEIIE